MKKIIEFLTFFTSLSTLICCALPALIVTLGAGASLAGILSNFPQLIWISEYKIPLFIFAGVMILTSYSLKLYQKKKDKECNICTETSKSSNIILACSLIIYLIGFSFAFLIRYIS